MTLRSGPRAVAVAVAAAIIALTAVNAVVAAEPAHAKGEPGSAPPSLPDVRFQEVLPDGAADFVSGIERRVRPGETIVGRVVVTNITGEERHVRIVGVDATTASNLGLAFTRSSARAKGDGRWVKSSRSEATVASGSQQSVPFQASVPPDASPGDHVLGVAVEVGVTESLSPGTGDRPLGQRVVNVVRQILTVKLTVPGPRTRALEFGQVRTLATSVGVRFLVKARNSGNVYDRKVRGELTVSLGPRRVAGRDFGPAAFVPGTEPELVVATKEKPAAGTTYRVRGWLRYGGKRVAQIDEFVRFPVEQARIQARSFGGPPVEGALLPVWAWIPIGLGVLGAAAGGLWGYRRWKRMKPLGQQRALALLEQELGALYSTGQPVSVTTISGAPTERRGRASFVSAIRGRLRPSDTLCDMEASGVLMVIEPNTAAETAAGIASDLRNAVGASVEPHLSSVRVGSATAEHPTAPGELIERAYYDAT